MIGQGDINCVNQLGEGMNDTYLWDCGVGSACNTHMEVMWLPGGNQEHSLKLFAVRLIIRWDQTKYKTIFD